MGVNPDLIDYDELTDEPLKLKDLSENLVATGFRTVKFKGVEVENFKYRHQMSQIMDGSGIIILKTATIEWGRKCFRQQQIILQISSRNSAKYSCNQMAHAA